MSEWTIPIHGEDAANPAELESYLECMPAGRWIPENWASEDIRVVCVTIEEAGWALKSVAAAFPPYAGDAGYVFVIPRLAHEILSWNADEFAHFAGETIPLPEGLDVEVCAQFAAHLLHEYAVSEDEIAEVLNEVADLIAADDSIDPDELAAVAGTLLKESDGCVDNVTLVRAAADILRATP